jgi:hypothetical protein
LADKFFSGVAEQAVAVGVNVRATLIVAFVASVAPLLTRVAVNL